MVEDHNEEEVLELEDVEAIDEDSEKLLCLIGDQEVWVSKEYIPDYSDVQEKGDVGVLALPGWVVDELELVV
jgi:hypothetical protein